MSPPEGDRPAPRAAVADWGLARIVEGTALTGAGGARMREDPAARDVLADLCRRRDVRRREAEDGLLEAVLVHDGDGRLVAANRRSMELLGLDPAAAAAATAHEPGWRAVRPDGTVLAPGDQPTGRALRTGEAQRDVTMGVRRRDGALVWVAADAVPVHGPGGAGRRVVTALVDVTAEQEAAAEQRRNEDAFRLLAEQSGDVVARLDMENRYVYVSPACERVYGWSPGEMVGRSAFDFIHPDDVAARRRLRLELLEGREAASGEFRALAPDGGWIPVRGTLALLRASDGAPVALLSTTRDMRRRRAADEALRRATEQFTSAFAHAPIGMAIVGVDGRFLRVNRALCDLVGHCEDDLLALSFQDITHPEDLHADMALIEAILRGERAEYTMEKRYVRADGRVIWALLAVSLVTDADGVPLHFISQIQDISERRELEVRLREQAERDHLTGLYNRRRFHEELRREIGRVARTGEAAMLAMIDLDRFKDVNDRDGHAAGDELLRAVGQALAARLRRSDTLGRLGGDEFAALLVGADEEAGSAIAHMLVRAVHEVAGAAGPVSASVGLARIEADDEPDSVLARADEAMYAAKASGRGAVHVGAEPE
ncbi:MAG TPA: PAS domain S-box protein [Miltoncostaeaceae bacterium]|nr:PAS domain S-box protein [Miltoncostaeaceae bacterium]